MSLNARNATAADFDSVAQQHADATWKWLILGGIIYYFFDWWAIAPGLLALLAIVQSVSATLQAQKLRKGTYKIPNPNNGAPDGDARNIS
ncbi:hypothetical protein [Paremcibacter congregatus]|uniref:Uncharacterized protein n=1 Tax=Paremcibacter congregatus TaxID=2043170 RepID=A0A2G4YUC4_9PROT|nr:hypothetical protein [Paremcibacter congregatus]PHZ85934.1 hypothetical protein CRD36_04465 [Paremcibacter congregatus]QDE26899.1 hypothetical protein FIV45_06235 [Paremcibacter congregatus]